MRWGYPFKKILVYIVLLSFSLFTFSCYTIKPGSVVNSYVKENRDTIVGYLYEISTPQKPSFKSHLLKLRIIEKPVYQKVRVKERKLEVHDQGLIVFMGIGGIGSLLTALSTDPETGKVNWGPFWAFGGIASVFLLIHLPAESAAEKRVRNKTKKETEIIENNDPRVLSTKVSTSSRIIIRYGSLKKVYTITRNQFANSFDRNIDLVNDFNLKKFKSAQKINVNIEVPEMNLHKTITLDNQDWTKPYFFPQKTAFVQTEVNNKVVTIGKVSPGHKYEVLHEGELIKIRLGDQQGYVEKAIGEVWWMVP